MPVRKPNLSPGLTPEAQEAMKEFLGDYEGFLHVNRRLALKILVWGPSPRSKSRVARKRAEIRDELKKLGHWASFSEDLPPTAPGFSERTKEYAQARAVDLIIVLMEDSPGAIGEVHDFSGDPDIFPKLQVMVPKRYRDGYSGSGALRDLEDATGGGGVHWYEEGEIRSCDVLTRAVRRAEALRVIHLKHRSGRFPR